MKIKEISVFTLETKSFFSLYTNKHNVTTDPRYPLIMTHRSVLLHGFTNSAMTVLNSAILIDHRIDVKFIDKSD